MLPGLRQTPACPSAALVMKRTVVLKRIVVKALATPPRDVVDEWSATWKRDEFNRLTRETRKQFASDVAWLQTNGLWSEVSEHEREFLQAGIGEVSEQARIDASWLAESIVCLLWALGYVSELPPYDQEADHELFRNAPNGTDVRVLVNQARLLPFEFIERQRDISELWHWRCRTTHLLQSGQLTPILKDGTSMYEVIAQTAAKAAEDRIISAPLSGDFPSFGKPFRELTDREVAQVTSIAQERHRAFNWLCGHAPANRWEDTPTDT